MIRRMVEELRRLKYRPTGGFAQFLFADAQPGITWSVLDHERGPSSATTLREAGRPVIVVADRLPATVARAAALALDVHVVSDLRAPVDGARVTAGWPGPGRPHVAVERHVDADACERVGTIQGVVPAVGPPPDRRSSTLDLELPPDGEVVTNHDESRIT